MTVDTTTGIQSVESVAVLPCLAGPQHFSFSLEAPLYRILVRRLPRVESSITINGVRKTVKGSTFFLRCSHRTTCFVALENMGVEIIAVRFKTFFLSPLAALHGPSSVAAYAVVAAAATRLWPLHHRLETRLRKLRVRDDWVGIREDWERYRDGWLKAFHPPTSDAPRAEALFLSPPPSSSSQGMEGVECCGRTRGGQMRIVDLSVDLPSFRVDNDHRLFTVYTDATNGTKFAVRRRNSTLGSTGGVGGVAGSAGTVFLIPPQDCIPPRSIEWLGNNRVPDFPFTCFWDMCLCLPHPEVEDRRDLLVMLHLVRNQIFSPGSIP